MNPQKARKFHYLAYQLIFWISLGDCMIFTVDKSKTIWPGQADHSRFRMQLWNIRKLYRYGRPLYFIENHVSRFIFVFNSGPNYYRSKEDL